MTAITFGIKAGCEKKKNIFDFDPKQCNNGGNVDLLSLYLDVTN
jgi:hypothetical protein